MDEYYENYIQELDNRIRQIKLEIKNPISLTQELVKMLLDSLKDLRDFVINHYRPIKIGYDPIGCSSC